MLADGDALPRASALEVAAAAREASAVAVTLIPVVLPGRARRVNVTLGEALLEEPARLAATVPASSPKPPAPNSPAAGLNLHPGLRHLLAQELLWGNAGLLQDRAKGAFRHIAGMIGDGCVFKRGRVSPDFMRASTLPVKLKAEQFKPADD